MKHTLALALAATVLIASPALAHNQWIKPSASTVSGADGWVTFDAASSTDVFNADHQPLRLEALKAYDPSGAEVPVENAMRGRYRSTFDLHLTKQGTWRVAVENTGVTGTYKLDGKDYRVGGRAGPNATVTVVPGDANFVPPAGATDVKLNLNANRNEVLVTLGKPTPIKLSNKGLEMQPITHPADLVADEAGKFRFLVDGKPAANLKLEVVPDGRRFRNAQGEISVTTDAKGEASVQWTGAGVYWMRAAFSDETSPRPGITGRRFQYMTSVEVLAP